MKSLSFGNFQVGMLDDPTVEDRGGFEFASGMDIFSEPGVMKSCTAMTEVGYGVGATPTDVPSYMAVTETASTVKGYIIAGDKVLESATTSGDNWNLFLTNANGNNLGLGIYNDYVWYAAASLLGRAPVGNAAAKNDSYNALPTDAGFHPMMPQAGTLKIGAGRYVSSVDEASAVIQQALKLPVGYRVRSLEEHFTRLFMGTEFGGVHGVDFTHNATVFDWNGIPLASGSALPGTPYPLKLRGMKALLSDGQHLFGFPDNLQNIHRFDGGSFSEYRKLYSSLISGVATGGSVCKHMDGSVLFGGASFNAPGVFEMRNGAICQSYIPSVATPGTARNVTISMVASSFNARVIIGFLDGTDSSYHIQYTYSGADKQNNSVFRSLWHKAKTDKLKRWGGVKLNLKTLPAGTSVAVAYRTTRDAAFSSTQGTITSANQSKPVMFPVNPRSREIQFKFTYTTSTTSTPELLTYDPIFEVINSNR